MGATFQEPYNPHIGALTKNQAQSELIARRQTAHCKGIVTMRGNSKDLSNTKW